MLTYETKEVKKIVDFLSAHFSDGGSIDAAVEEFDRRRKLAKSSNDIQILYYAYSFSASLKTMQLLRRTMHTKMEQSEDLLAWLIAAVQVCYDPKILMPPVKMLEQSDFSSIWDRVSLQAFATVACNEKEETEVSKDFTKLLATLCEKGDVKVLKNVVTALANNQDAIDRLAWELGCVAFSSKNEKALDAFKALADVSQEKSIVRALYQILVLEARYKENKVAETIFDEWKRNSNAKIRSEIMVALIWGTGVSEKQDKIVERVSLELYFMVANVFDNRRDPEELIEPLKALIPQFFEKKHKYTEMALRLCVSKLSKDSIGPLILNQIEELLRQALKTKNSSILEKFCDLCVAQLSTRSLSFFPKIKKIDMRRQIAEKIKILTEGYSKDSLPDGVSKLMVIPQEESQKQQSSKKRKR